MKNISITLIAAVLCVGSALAQSGSGITSVHYWIDDDREAEVFSPSTEFEVDCSNLIPGLHKLHYRLVDSIGRYSALHEHNFVKVETPRPAASVVSVQYWFDNNNTSAIIDSLKALTIDCNALGVGLHTLHYRVADSNGRYSALHEHNFLKVAPPETASAIESIQYWWDDMHQSATTAPYSADAFTLSTDTLRTGLHSLNIRVKDDAGRWSPNRRHFFYKGEKEDSVRIVGYSYWWNDLTDNMVTKTLDSPAKSLLIDDDIVIPESAKTGFAGHYTARLNVIITNSLGRAVYAYSDVAYPDNDAPTTDIDADSYVASTSVRLTWSELTGDKMGDYNVYVSKDGEPFLLWLPDTKQTSATFKGERGHVYLFTVTGRDAFGNREEYDESKNVSVTFE